MYTFLTRNGQTIAFGLGLVVTVLMLLLIFGGVAEFEAIPDDDLSRYDTTIFNFGLYAAIGLVILCFIAAVLFGIYQLATNPKGALKGLAGLGAIVVLFFILYSSADANADMLERLSDFNVSTGQSQFITGAIATALILAAAGILATVVGEVINFFK